MKLEDARFQFILMPDSRIGIEDLLSGDQSEIGSYYLPADILHIALRSNHTLPSMPRMSAESMSRLLNKKIVAIYLELP